MTQLQSPPLETAATPAGLATRPEAAGSPSIRLRVRGADGKERSVDFAGASEADAIRKAAARGLQVLAIESGVEAPVWKLPMGGQRFPLLLFSQELLTLLEAGLNLTEALATLHAKERAPATRATLAGILQALREGRNFSDVLAAAPAQFSEVYVATVRASERTGDLPHALARYIAYQLQFDAIRKKLISTAIYPVMLLVIGGFVTLFLLGYVVPRFSAVYESAGRDIPFLSQMLLRVGNVVNEHWQLVLPGFVVLLAMAGVFVWRPEGRAFLLNLFLRFPGIASRAGEFRLSRFYRAVSLLLASGIALPRALGMVTGLLGPGQQANLDQCRLQVEQGQSLSSALLATGLATPIAESLVRVGERSGRLADMLERAARFHDEDFARWIDWASRLLEPILMMAIGLVIGSVVVLMYMPIFELAGSLQ